MGSFDATLLAAPTAPTAQTALILGAFKLL
jgi:hypothetical protein